MTNSKLKIVFFGTSDFVVPVLEGLDREFEVVGVVTTADNKAPSPVALAAERIKIPLFKAVKFDEELVDALKNLEAEIFVVASFGKIIPQEVLDIPKFGSLNIHPSFLPKYRGPSPLQAAILAGDSELGVSIILMDKEVDHGPILVQSKVNIEPEDTFLSLGKKGFEEGVRVLTEILPDFIAGRVQPIEQDHKKATFTEHINKEDGFFEIDNPPSKEKLDKMIRAYFPWPTVWTRWSFGSAQDKKVKIVKFLPFSSHPRPDRGSINSNLDSRVRGNDMFLVQIEGKKPTDLKSFLNGYPDFPIKEL